MRVLITRPLADARTTADLMRDRGVEPVIEPLFSISIIPAANADTTDAQGFLITSANGARSLAETLERDHPEAFGLPAYCVGEASAATARERGFSQVRSADGDVTALAALVRAKARPEDGVLVHAAGTHVAGDLSGLLEEEGFSVRRQRLYETRQAVALSRETADLLATKSVHAALFYSPRTAKIFVDLARKAKVADACADIVAYCLSQAVADDLRQIPFARVRTAAEPNQDSLLALFDADRAAGVFADAEGDIVMTDRPEKDAKETEDKDTGKPAGKGGASDTGKGKADAASPASGNAPGGSGKGKGGSGTAKGGGRDADTDNGKAQEKGRPGSDKDATAAGGVGSVPPATASTKSSTATAGGGSTSTSAATSSPSTSGPGGPGRTNGGPNGSGQGGGQPAKKQGHPVRNTAIGVGVVIVALAVAYGSMPYWRDNIPAAYHGFLPPYPQADQRLTEVQAENEALRGQVTDLQARLSDLSSQIGNMQNRLSEVADRPAAAAELPPDVTRRLADMESQLQVLSNLDPQALEQVAAAGEAAGQEVQALRQELGEIRRGTADASTVLAMQERLDRVQGMAQQMASRQDTALAFVLTTAQLRQAIDQGNPYEAELRTVRAIADEMPKVSLPDDGVLTAHAEDGIPTREMLAERFDRLSADIIRAAAAPDDAPAWVQKTVQRVMGLVTVRRTDGEAVGDSAPAVVARADSALNAGNLQAALNELSKLEGEAAAAAQGWIDAAQARLGAEDVVSDLTAEALARFAATERGTDPSDTGAGTDAGGGAAGQGAATGTSGATGTGG
ncbi:uroporphyrinogen-III synthase [Caenispirillum salinarum]|uniref:uroporphyrinogen-III synthase n=1 Tax=Caenispirillum salinarum TaxID=859058 RepID=UPI00384EE9A5